LRRSYGRAQQARAPGVQDLFGGEQQQQLRGEAKQRAAAASRGGGNERPHEERCRRRHQRHLGAGRPRLRRLLAGLVPSSFPGTNRALPKPESFLSLLLLHKCRNLLVVPVQILSSLKR